MHYLVIFTRVFNAGKRTRFPPRLLSFCVYGVKKGRVAAFHLNRLKHRSYSNLSDLSVASM